MKYAYALLVIVLIYQSLATERNSSDIISLSEQTFDKYLNENKFLFIMFYAPWCSYSKELLPEFEKAAQYLKDNNSKVKFVKIDATEELQLAEDFNITGYPTMKFIIEGDIVLDYESNNTSEDIVKFIDKKLNPLIKITNRDELDSFTSSGFAVIYIGDITSLTYKGFLEVAYHISTKSKVFSFIEKGNMDLLTSLNIQNDKDKENVIILSKYIENGIITFPEDKDITDALHLEAFIKTNTIPPISYFDSELIETLFMNDIPGLFLYRDERIHLNEESAFREACSLLKSKYINVITGLSSFYEQKLSEYTGFTINDLPLVVIHKVKGEILLKYIMKSKEITKENILSFVNDYEKGIIKESLKSAEIPKEQPVHYIELVGQTFEDNVINNNKDVFVLFYAPWCTHCIKVKPIFNDLALKLQKFNHFITFAQIDATQNELKDIVINAYPTLYFYKSKDKSKPIVYSGDRTIASMLLFVKQNVSAGLIDDKINVVDKKVEAENDSFEDDQDSSKAQKEEKVDL